MTSETKPKTLIIVQARMGSTRLPGKVLKQIIEKPLIFYLVERLKRVKNSHSIVIATSTNALDDTLANYCMKTNIPVFRGSENDVLQRYYDCAKEYGADFIVRICSDCPLIDPALVDDVIEQCLIQKEPLRIASNVIQRTYPRGMDTEVFTFQALEEAAMTVTSVEEREHVTLNFYRHPNLYHLISVKSNKNTSNYRLTVDTQEDFELISKIFTALYPKNPAFTLQDVLQLLKANPEWLKINAHIKQKETG